MNTDRFLTRVWDKQEKKMLYPLDIFSFNCLNEYTYYGVFNENIICNYIGTSIDCPDDGNLMLIPFGDRFIPMLCLGWKDKNKKLIYAEDICKQGKDIFIVKYNYNYGRFEKEYITADFPVNELASTCVQPFWSGKPSCEIIGNICEDAHLLNRGEDASKNTKTN